MSNINLRDKKRKIVKILTREKRSFIAAHTKISPDTLTFPYSFNSETYAQKEARIREEREAERKQLELTLTRDFLALASYYEELEKEPYREGLKELFEEKLKRFKTKAEEFSGPDPKTNVFLEYADMINEEYMTLLGEPYFKQNFLDPLSERFKLAPQRDRSLFGIEPEEELPTTQ